LFNDDLLCILTLTGKGTTGFLIIACHRETAYDLHCCAQQDHKRYATSDISTYVSIGGAKEQQVYEAALRPVQVAGFKAAATLYQGTSLVQHFPVK